MSLMSIAKSGANKLSSAATAARNALAQTGLVEALPTDAPAKAEIRVYQKSDGTPPSFTEISDRKIDCQFRPSEISISKSTQWQESNGAGKNVPTNTFTGGKSAKMDLNLFFDTTDTGQDVSDTTDKLFALVLKQEKDEAASSPPYCRFFWGNIATFMSFVTDVTVKFTMFLPNGTPVRAEAKVTLNQFTDEERFSRQNPTSYSEARKTWVVLEGQTLDWIAYQEYGSPTHWRHIAETNDLMNPMDLRPGQILRLVPLP